MVQREQHRRGIRAAAAQTAAFRRDVTDTRRLLEDLGGVPVRGYRAPSFSIGPSQWWAFNVLGEAGYGYSSSLHPIAHDH